MEKNIKKNNKKLCFPNNFLDLSIFLVILSFFAFRDIPLLFYGSQILFIITMIIYLREKKKINISYSITCIFFLGWIVTSFLWSTSLENATKFFREVIQISVICSLLSFYCDDTEKAKKILEYVAISSGITLIYIIIKTPPSEWTNIYNYNLNTASSNGRLGTSIGLHPNTMGTLCAIACLMWLYIYRLKKNKISFLWIAISIILILFTKSRGSILMMISLIFLYWLFEKPRVRSVIYKLIICIVLFFSSLWAVFNIGFLYNLVGFRFEGMLGIFDSNSTIDASTNGRETLQKIGIEIIKDYPILGVGAGNYANMAFNNYGLWREVYSHSNFIEILANLGIIGFLIYYIPRLWCIIALLKSIKLTSKTERQMCAMLCGFCISSFIFDFIKISYNNDAEQILYAISFCFAIIILKRKKVCRIEAEL